MVIDHLLRFFRHVTERENMNQCGDECHHRKHHGREVVDPVTEFDFRRGAMIRSQPAHPENRDSPGPLGRFFRRGGVILFFVLFIGFVFIMLGIAMLGGMRFRMIR